MKNRVVEEGYRGKEKGEQQEKRKPFTCLCSSVPCSAAPPSVLAWLFMHKLISCRLQLNVW